MGTAAAAAAATVATTSSNTTTTIAAVCSAVRSAVGVLEVSGADAVEVEGERLPHVVVRVEVLGAAVRAADGVLVVPAPQPLLDARTVEGVPVHHRGLAHDLMAQGALEVLRHEPNLFFSPIS